jgi:signal transduction histidine kinase/signal recognition particle receptor subunit beta
VAQWRHADRTLCAKLVYYGPALGGKTTNLRSLHRITDPEGVETLLSVNTSADRTLFFDLLPFDLGTILGYKVALKVYTVPGQVRYDATRRVVLAGADAVVFVADSSRAVRGDNRASLENLRVNLHANGFDPDRLPILYQFNKQDLPDAAPPEEVAAWLGVDPRQGHPAVAIADRGVLEVFVSAARAMLERLVESADERTRRALESDDLGRQVERAFAPHKERLAGAKAAGTLVEMSTHEPTTLRLRGEGLLEQSVETSVRLADGLATSHGRAQRLEREREALKEDRGHLETLVKSRTEALRKAYEELRQVERMKDRFLSGLSHEMKRPLTAVVSAASFLADSEGDPAARAEMAKSLRASAQTLERLMNDLLRVARLERDSTLDVHDVTAERVARDALDLAGGSRVQVRIDERLGPVRVDRARLARALANLVDNATKFSPPDAEIELRVLPVHLRQGGSRRPAVAFSVMDRGPGVAPEDRERIFAPFEQGGNGADHKPPGIGIGLHEAATIARWHEGALRYVEREGGGSEFRIVIPLEAVHA